MRVVGVIISFFLQAAHILGQSETNALKIPVDNLVNLRRGSSVDDLRTLLGVKPLYQFTASVESNEFLCVSVALEHPRGTFYFLYRDKRLTAILDPPKPEWE